MYGVTAVGFPGIDSNLTLTIPAGTKIYGHKDATLLVYKSTLIVNGALNDEVVFQGDRLENFYNDVTGQWRGIYLSQAKNCEINYSIIKNGAVGIQVDTSSSSSTLNLNNSIITNNEFYNLFAVAGPTIIAKNTVFGDAGIISTYSFAGGNLEFTNCNFTNYWTGGRSGPSLALKNWYELTPGNNIEKELTVKINNCVIYGNAADEFIIDSLANSNTLFDVTLANCLIKREVIYDYTYLSDIIWNQNPNFIDTELKDFHFNEQSPLIDAGNIINYTPQSIDGISRGSTPDIGAYEF